MARIRTTKPEYWRDVKMLRLTRDARLFFLGLWNHVDDDGRRAYDPDQIKMDVFPGPLESDLDIAPLVEVLCAAGRILIYEVAGQEYLAVVNFPKHQKIDRRTPSKYPPPPIHSDFPRFTPSPPEHSTSPPEHSTSPPEHSTSPPDGREGKGREGKGENTSRPRKVGGTPDDEALAKRMYEAIRAVAPSAKEPAWTSWANAIRLMREQDERSLEQIEELFRWANNDSFWRANILSPGTLRDQWTKLEAKMLAEGGGKRGQRAEAPPGGTVSILGVMADGLEKSLTSFGTTWTAFKPIDAARKAMTTCAREIRNQHVKNIVVEANGARHAFSVEELRT